MKYSFTEIQNPIIKNSSNRKGIGEQPFEAIRDAIPQYSYYKKIITSMDRLQYCDGKADVVISGIKVGTIEKIL